METIVLNFLFCGSHTSVERTVLHGDNRATFWKPSGSNHCAPSRPPVPSLPHHGTGGAARSANKWRVERQRHQHRSRQKAPLNDLKVLVFLLGLPKSQSRHLPRVTLALATTLHTAWCL